jgi:RNA exonuclease 4
MSSMAGNGVFLTKKQKKQLKERRRKKKQKLVTAVADVVVEGSSLVHAAVAASRTATEEIDDQDKLERETTRPQDDDEDLPGGVAAITDTAIKTAKEEEDEDEVVKSTLKRKRPQSSDTTTTSTSSTMSSTIYIPDDVYENPRAVKKFRKDARRDAKRNGASDEAVAKLKFVKESDRPTRKFPVLKELVQEQRDLKKQQEAEQETASTTAADAATATTTTTVDPSQYVALDCEMVGIGTDGKQSVVARASIVDWNGQCLYDRYVQVPVHVTDFRTKYSGITPAHLKAKQHRAVTPAQCRQDVSNLLKDKILVGHALHNDLDVLMLQHTNVRDTAKYRPFQRLHHVVGGSGKQKYRPRKLKDLVAERLDQTIQTGSHDSVQDAAAAMALYRSVHIEWEQEIALQLTKKKNQSHNSKKKRS